MGQIKMTEIHSDPKLFHKSNKKNAPSLQGNTWQLKHSPSDIVDSEGNQGCSDAAGVREDFKQSRKARNVQADSKNVEVT